MDKRTAVKFVFFLFLISQISFSQNNIRVKIMTFNIYHGETMNGDFDFDAIANIILNEKVDFVALQEVDFKTNRVNKIDLANTLANKTEMYFAFGKAIDFDGGDYGVAILSKYKIIKKRNIALPHGKDKEPRTALEITSVLQFEDTISIISTHLDYTQKDHFRLEQIHEINKVFLTNKYPTILAGDLNDIPESETIQYLEKYWTSTYNYKNPDATYPSSNPNQKLDYIMFTPKTEWKIISSKVIHNKIASDHFAYVVILELKSE